MLVVSSFFAAVADKAGQFRAPSARAYVTIHLYVKRSCRQRPRLRKPTTCVEIAVRIARVFGRKQNKQERRRTRHIHLCSWCPFVGKPGLFGSTVRSVGCFARMFRSRACASKITDLNDWSALRVRRVAPRAFLDTLKRTHPDRDIDAKDVPHAVIVRAGSRVMAPPALSALHGFVGVTLPVLQRLFVKLDLPRPKPTVDTH